MARWVKSHQQMRIYKVATAPTTSDGLKVGDIWIDTTADAALNLCTAISPSVTWDLMPVGGTTLSGYTSTATAAGTTTLTVNSTHTQIFTGSTTQTVTLPVVSTLELGTPFQIVNLSTGVVTVNSSGGNAVQAMQANSTLNVISNATTGTGAAVWHVVGYDAAASGQTGSGSLVRATSPALVTPVLGVASATSMSFSSTSGIIGTTTNDNAAAGSVGELISADLLVANKISLTTATEANIISTSLSAGDWEVSGQVVFVVNPGSTVVTRYIWWVSSTSATIPSLGADFNAFSFSAGNTPLSTTAASLGVRPTRFSLSGTTTIYLSVYADFSASTLEAYGQIRARRIR